MHMQFISLVAAKHTSYVYINHFQLVLTLSVVLYTIRSPLLFNKINPVFLPSWDCTGLHPVFNALLYNFPHLSLSLLPDL